MTYVPEALRRLVKSRADARCEYCLIQQEHCYISHEVDHIYAEKHGGATNSDNVCLSCSDCNRHKGSDLCSLDPLTGKLTALFHPRNDAWAVNFRINLDGRIEGLTPSGRVTVNLLQFNDIERFDERARLIALGVY